MEHLNTGLCASIVETAEILLDNRFFSYDGILYSHTPPRLGSGTSGFVTFRDTDTSRVGTIQVIPFLLQELRHEGFLPRSPGLRDALQNLAYAEYLVYMGLRGL